MTRRIDHLVLAVRDLDAAAAFYDRLGFQVGARNHHPWGTDNHVIQFGSSFLELITVADAGRIPPHAPRSFSFGAFVRDYLAHREGLAMFVLDSDDAQADAAAFARQGIGDYAPFTFERSGRAADGTETHVGFSLAFATDDRLPDTSFFVCQQHHPEAFWSTPLQRHDNGATNVVTVTLGVARPQDHTDVLSAFTGVQPSVGGSRYDLNEHGRLQVVPDAAPHGFRGFSVAVPGLHRAAQHLTAYGIRFEERPDRLVVAPEHAFGAQICFEVT